MGDIAMKKISFIIVLLLVMIFLYPIVITFTNSFMDEGEIEYYYKGFYNGESLYNVEDNNYFSIAIVPQKVTLEQYFKLLLMNPQYMHMYKKTLKLVLPMLFLHVFITIPAAYALAKTNFKFKSGIIYIYILLALLPFQVTGVPNYFMLNRLKLLDTQLAIILPGIFSTLGVLLLYQFIKNIPDETIEAAVIDGANNLQILVKIIIPQTLGGIALLIVFTFIDYWNMVEQPLIFISNKAEHPLSVYLNAISNEMFEVTFAASFLYMIPMVLLFIGIIIKLRDTVLDSKRLARRED